jgi:hypothetical protein
MVAQSLPAEVCERLAIKKFASWNLGRRNTVCKNLFSCSLSTNKGAAGEYPECALDALKQLHISGNRGSNYCSTEPIEAGKGEKTDLYNLVLGEGQNAFVAHGKSRTIVHLRFC